MAKTNDAGEQAAGGQGQQRIVVRVDERNIRTGYANAFRTNAMDDEVLLDFGMNSMVLPSQEGAQPEILLQINERVVMNYYVAKRLTLALGQIIRRHEEQFGELELDTNKRRKGNV
jgi:hypothetical protein